MAKLDMDGPLKFEEKVILEALGQPMPGNFALGHLGADRSFEVLYVGMAENSLQESLLKCLKSNEGQAGFMGRLSGKKSVNAFKYSYAANPEAAYQKLCRNYHDFGESKKLNNKSHPRPPKGRDWACNRCTQELTASIKIKTK